MRQKPPPEAPDGADEVAAPERALRPMPPHDGPFVPPQGPLAPAPVVVTEPAPETPPAPGLVRSFGAAGQTEGFDVTSGPFPERTPENAAWLDKLAEASKPEPSALDPESLPTVEELAARFDLVKRDALGRVRVDENGRPRLAFMGAFLFAKEGYAVGQRVAPADFEAALDAAKNEPLDGRLSGRAKLRRVR